MKKHSGLQAMALAALLGVSALAGSVSAAGKYVYEDEDIKLIEYKGIAYTALKMDVDEEEIDVEIEETLNMYAEDEQILEGKAKDGDAVNIDFVGTLDGEPFDGGSYEGYDIILGSGTFVPGFEEGVVGMEVGEKKDIDVTFPEDYFSENLAGKAVVFAVTLNYICGEEIIPELTDDWVKENLEMDSIEAYRESIRADLEEEAQAQFEEEQQNEILRKLAEGCEVMNLDEEAVQNYVDYMVNYFTQYAQMFGKEYADFLGEMGYTEETALADFTLQGENNEKLRMILDKIAELEKLSLTDEEFDEKLQELVEQYPDEFETVDDVKAELEENDALESYRRQYLEEKVIAFLIENAVYADDEELDEEEELVPVTEDTVEEASEAVSEEAEEATAQEEKAAEESSQEAEAK